MHIVTKSYKVSHRLMSKDERATIYDVTDGIPSPHTKKKYAYYFSCLNKQWSSYLCHWLKHLVIRFLRIYQTCMSAAEGHVSIPENSNLTRLLNQLLSELWKAGRIDRAAIDRILDAGKR